MSDVADLMKRCQRGVGGRNALDEAHDIMAECYGTLGKLEAERDALAAELAAIKGQEPVAFYWQDIGYPEPRTHGPYFGQPSESALRNVDGRAIPVLLYTLPPHRKEGGE